MSWPKLAQQKCSKLLEITHAGPKKLLKIVQSCSKLIKTAQNCSKLLKTAQNCSKLLKIWLKMPQNFSKCLNMGQQVSKGVMCLHMQVRKLSLLGIAVAGVYCCMGLRSVSIAPGSSLLLRSDPLIVNFNWQGSLVIRLAAIVSINGLSHKIIIALVRKTVHARSFFCFITASVIPQSDMNFQDFLWFFWDLKGIGLNLTDLHPKLRTVKIHRFCQSIGYSKPVLNPYQSRAKPVLSFMGLYERDCKLFFFRFFFNLFS